MEAFNSGEKNLNRVKNLGNNSCKHSCFVGYIFIATEVTYLGVRRLGILSQCHRIAATWKGPWSSPFDQRPSHDLGTWLHGQARRPCRSASASASGPTAAEEVRCNGMLKHWQIRSRYWVRIKANNLPKWSLWLQKSLKKM